MLVVRETFEAMMNVACVTRVHDAAMVTWLPTTGALNAGGRAHLCLAECAIEPLGVRTMALGTRLVRANRWRAARCAKPHIAMSTLECGGAWCR